VPAAVKEAIAEGTAILVVACAEMAIANIPTKYSLKSNNNGTAAFGRAMCYGMLFAGLAHSLLWGE